MNALGANINVRAQVVRALFVILCFASSSALCADFWGKSIGYLGGGDSRPCVFFNLVGVSPADPALPGVDWFVLPKTHPQFKESFALLMAAKLTGKLINVTTTGLIDPCGHAQVASVALVP